MQIQKKTTITCVIPTVGRRTLFQHALPSALRQVKPFDEIIVVNDSGRDIDNAESIEWSSVRFLNTKGRCGGAAARALGFRVASTSLVVFLDDDDELDVKFTSYLHDISSYIDSDFAIIVPEVKKTWVEGRLPNQRARKPVVSKRNLDLPSQVFNIIHWAPATFSGLVVNRGLLNELPLNQQLPAFHELSLLQEIQEKGHKCLYYPKLLVTFYQYFSESRITSDVARRIRTVRDATNFGLILSDAQRESIILGSILSHVRVVAYREGFFAAINDGVSLIIREKPKLFGYPTLLKIGLNVGACLWLAIGRFLSLPIK